MIFDDKKGIQIVGDTLIILILVIVLFAIVSYVVYTTIISGRLVHLQ